MLNNLFSRFVPLGNTRKNSLSIPVLDGAYKPNNLLEEAEVLVEQSGLSDLVVGKNGCVMAAYGSSVCDVSDDGTLTTIATFAHQVTALAALNDGTFAVGLGDSVIIAHGTVNERVIDEVAGKKLVAVTALYQHSDGGLLICDGSDKHGCQDWAWDLMGKNRKGRLIWIDIQSGDSKVLASDLAYAFGAFDSAETGTLVSESWSHNVSMVTQNRAKSVIDRMAGYPCRFAAAEGGGFWLTLFSSRTQLVEFVLKENDYRQEMMATIDPAYWIAPSFGSGGDFLEPLQGGGVKQMGILKPWAPPRSYGLLVRYDSNLTPLYSLHSRVGGRNHGVCAVVQTGDKLLALSKGSGRILKMSITAIEATLLGGNEK